MFLIKVLVPYYKGITIMNISSLEYFINEKDWTEQCTTSKAIATNFLEIYKLYNEDAEKNKNLVIKFKNKLISIQKTNPRKYKAVQKAFKELVDKYNKEVSDKQNKNLLKDNLKRLKPYFNKEEFNKFVELINTHHEAFSIALHFEFCTNNLATNILNNSEFKKTNNLTRNRNLLVRKLKYLELDENTKSKKIKEYDEKWTFDEYLKVCQDNLFQTLTEKNNVGKDRAKRISSKVKKAIKNYHTK
jgi:hypothetical protein